MCVYIRCNNVLNTLNGANIFWPTYWQYLDEYLDEYLQWNTVFKKTSLCE